ncbi:AraC family transcriptional regulator [Psychrobacter sp. JCM 18900]
MNKVACRSSGYDDISSFTRLFKRATELTPKEYQDKFSRLAI